MQHATSTSAARSRGPGRSQCRRRGVATIWLILSLPIFAILLCAVLEVGNAWVARVELENSLEAAALAAAKEWGQNAAASGPGWTAGGRSRGMQLAAANTVREQSVTIASNLGTYDLGMNPNENKLCDDVKGPPVDGNLVFGKIIENTLTGELTFDASEAPSCGAGTIVVDASGSGNLQTAQNREWGISFHNTPLTPGTLRVVSVVLDAQAMGGTFVFTGVPQVSANLLDGLATNAVRDTSGNSQADVFGFANPATQITFSISGGGRYLTILFSADGGDDGFAPGDRFRFGAAVIRPPNNIDGDGVGGRVGVTVTFSTTAVASGILVDNTDRKNDCYDPRLIDPVTGTFVVNPSGVADLPCPPTAGVGSNGQSYVLLSGSGQDFFGVRAQATVRVSSICSNLFGIPVADYCVSAKTIALYTCSTRRARLVRIENFICASGNGAD